MVESDEGLAQAFRQAMRCVASTVNVISICDGGEPMGITATAMSSLALDPPSLLVCINRAASLYGSMESVSHFGVNVLHRDQEYIARMFADRQQHALRFASGWEVDGARPPRLADAQACFLCRRIDHHQFGTHSIFIGVVEDVVVRKDVDPLVYLNGNYGSTTIAGA
ncbi:flavin reductase family protein [Sphingosinicella rhizophila]|uniref:Flavin reductase family protein n=1 Tax=Sphingosinicella rhizophila TaxID=3050082 RepID=A0ABU3QC42_9SPHN|nr:flavin reductase family protein [Sphingosinicella sp. GR2756]MDT9600961.1 flavin reductase family protein [Sphingosinicella sp. GR2756]